MPDTSGKRSYYSRETLLGLRDITTRPSLDTLIATESLHFDKVHHIQSRVCADRQPSVHRQSMVNTSNLIIIGLETGVTMGIGIESRIECSQLVSIPTSNEPAPRRSALVKCQQLRRQTHAAASESSPKEPSLLYTNCRSLNTAKQLELELLVAEHNPEVICLTETWLTDMKEDLYNLSGYHTYTANRKNRVGGGVAIHMRSNLSSQKVSMLTSDTLSAVWTKMNRPGSTPIIVGCIYHPPGLTKDRDITTIDYILSTMSILATKNKRAKFIVCGDFNRLDMSTIAETFHLAQLVQFSTRGDVRLDEIYTDISSYSRVECNKLAPLCQNDHCCILLPSTLGTVKKHAYVMRRKYHASSKVDIGAAVAAESWQEVLSSNTVDEKVVAFHGIIGTILDRVCPKKRTKIREDDPKWYSPAVSKLRRAKSRAYKQGSKSYHFLTNLLKKLIAKNKRQRIDDTINNVIESKTWWRGIRELTETTSNKTKPNRHLIDGEWISNQRLCEELNTYFSSIGGNCLPTPPLTRDDNFGPTVVDIGLVKKRLKLIDISKSAHSQDFPAWISRDCAEDVCTPLTDIINTIFRERRFPSLWKRAEVLPLPKVKNVKALSDHRPISLLWHCGKIAEAFVMDRYKQEVLPKIKSDQYAYQQNKGTTDALLWAIDDWTKILDVKENAAVQVLFKDFSKAFDLMQPSLLIETLHSMNVSREACAPKSAGVPSNALTT